MAYVPERFTDHSNDRRLTEGQLLCSASVKKKPCVSPTKNGCANITPLRLCRYAENYCVVKVPSLPYLVPTLLVATIRK